MKNVLGFVFCLIGLVYFNFESISQIIKYFLLLYVGMKVISIIVIKVYVFKLY